MLVYRVFYWWLSYAYLDTLWEWRVVHCEPKPWTHSSVASRAVHCCTRRKRHWTTDHVDAGGEGLAPLELAPTLQHSTNIRLSAVKSASSGRKKTKGRVIPEPQRSIGRHGSPTTRPSTTPARHQQTLQDHSKTGPVRCNPSASYILLRFANTRTLVLRRTKTAIGTREFTVSAAVVWNSLRLELRMLSWSVQTFAKRLKKHLFISCYERISGFSIRAIQMYSLLLLLLLILLLWCKVNIS